MTKFKKENFQVGRGYKSYTTYCTESITGISPQTGKPFSIPNYTSAKFVARFRTAGAAGFCAFLIKNFTVEEYFGRLDAGESPLDIAGSKGYLLPHIRKWLKEGGYPLTQAGFKQFIADEAARRDARVAA